MKYLGIIIASTLLAVAAAEYDCPMNDHWVNVTSLPYRQGDLHPCQYAGTFQTSKPGADHNLFYWFFKHQDPQAPLVVWINGGPGATSMFGLFLENGPLRVTRNGTGSNDFVLKAADASWADTYSIVFIDQPVGTGFSYGNSVLTSMQDGSSEFTKFLVEFLQKYPQFHNNSMYLTGESYAGKYLPLFTSDILTWNEQMQYYPELQIPIQGTLIIDPYPSPVSQRTHMHIVPKALGLLDQTNLNQIATLEQKCEYYQTENASYGEDACNNIMDYIQAVSGNVFPYDGRIFDQDWNAVEQPYIDMLMNSTQKWQIYDLIHISNSTKWPIFEGDGSANVSEGYRDDNLVDYSSYYNELIQKNYPLIVMAGEFDMQDGIAGQYIWMKELLDVSPSFWKQTRQIYYFYNSQSNQTEVGGYWIQQGQFTLLTVPKSGHFIPANYYEASKSYLDDFVLNKTLNCHASSCGMAQQMCSAMNNCSGRGWCDNGQCKCYNSSFKGADCSNDVSYPFAYQNRGNFSGSGQKWAYFSGNLTGSQRFVINSTISYDMYISQENGSWSDPNPFNFDSQFLNMPANRSFTLRGDNLKSDGPFVMAMKVHAYDTANNKPLPFNVNYWFDYYRGHYDGYYGYHHNNYMSLLQSNGEGNDEHFDSKVPSISQIFAGIVALFLVVPLILIAIYVKNRKEGNVKVGKGGVAAGGSDQVDNANLIDQNTNISA